MSYKLTKGQNGNISVLQPVTLDRAAMTFLSIDKRRAGRPVVNISWDLGFTDAEGVFVVVNTQEYVSTPDEVSAFMANRVTAGNSYSKEFDDGIFAFLQTKGLIAAGVVEVD